MKKRISHDCFKIAREFDVWTDGSDRILFQNENSPPQSRKNLQINTMQTRKQKYKYQWVLRNAEKHKILIWTRNWMMRERFVRNSFIVLTNISYLLFLAQLNISLQSFDSVIFVSIEQNLQRKKKWERNENAYCDLPTVNVFTFQAN